MFVEVVDPFRDSVFRRRGDADVVHHDEVRDVLAESDAARMRAHRQSEFLGEQHHGEAFVDAPEPTGVELDETDRVHLHQLFEDDAILTLLAGGHADGGHRARDRGVTEDVVGGCRFFDPPRRERAKVFHPRDGFGDVPSLVRIHHQATRGADLFADDAAAPDVVLQIAADFDLEVVPPVGDTFAAQLTNLFVVVTEPTRGRDVRRITACRHFGFAVGSSLLVAAENAERVFGREDVGDVTEVDATDDVFGGHVRDQLPERFPDGLRPKVPDPVHDGGRREVNHALFGADPSELRIAGDVAPERAHVRGDVGKSLTEDLRKE